MATRVTKRLVQKTIELGGFLLEFAKIERATYIDRKGTPESDTDHTTMLAVMACALASELEPHLDLGKVAQYALVHDLVEVYAGDVNTIDFHSINHQSKAEEEAKALARIKQEFGDVFPWIHQTLERYESLNDAEARFVKTLDKAMPGITHIFADNRRVKETFSDAGLFEKSVSARVSALEKSYAHDQENAMELLREIIKIVINNAHLQSNKSAKKSD